MNALTNISANDQANVLPVAHKTLIGALAAGLAEVDGASKSAQNPHLKNKYADLSSVIAAIKPVARHGLWFRQVTRPDEGGARIETFYIHESGEMSAGEMFVPASKRDPQGFGSALTYCRRYALQTAFGIAPEDDDGEAATASYRAAHGAGERAKDAAPAAHKAEPASPQSDAISSDQLVKLQMLIKATSSNEIAFLRAMGAPDGARICDLPRALFDDAEDKLNAKLAKMAKAETNAKQAEQHKEPSPGQAAPFGEMLDDEIPF